MESIFSNVSPENIIKIFNCICENSPISRKSIAEITDLSIMTVGKATDGLRKAHALRSSKQQYISRGRRASVLMPNITKYIIVIDIAVNMIGVDVFDMTLNLRIHREMQMEYCALNDVECDDFIKGIVGEILQLYNSRGCIGIAIIFQGKYSESDGGILSSQSFHISSLCVEKQFETAFPDAPLIRISYPYAAAAEIAVTETGNFLYLHIGENDITAVPVFARTPIYPKLGDTVNGGSMEIGGLPASSKFTVSMTLDDCASTVARLIAQCRTIVSFARVYIDASRFLFYDFVEGVTMHMKDQPPYAREIEICRCEECIARFFAAKEARKCYIEGIVAEYCQYGAKNR